MLLLLQGCMNEYESIKRQDALILEEELATRQTSDKLAARAAAEKEKKQRKKVSSAASPLACAVLGTKGAGLSPSCQQSLKRAKTMAGLSQEDWQRCAGCCSVLSVNACCGLHQDRSQEAHCRVWSHKTKGKPSLSGIRLMQASTLCRSARRHGRRQRLPSGSSWSSRRLLRRQSALRGRSSSVQSWSAQRRSWSSGTGESSPCLAVTPCLAVLSAGSPCKPSSCPG